MQILNLKSVTIPNSCVYLETYVFSGCENIEEIRSFIEDPYPIPVECFLDVVKRNAILYVPKGAKRWYEVTEGWEDFATIVEDENMSGIKKIKDFGKEFKSRWYTPQGFHITNGPKGRGVYLRDGKKFVVK